MPNLVEICDLTYVTMYCKILNYLFVMETLSVEHINDHFAEFMIRNLVKLHVDTETQGTEDRINVYVSELFRWMRQNIVSFNQPYVLDWHNIHMLVKQRMMGVALFNQHVDLANIEGIKLLEGNVGKLSAKLICKIKFIWEEHMVQEFGFCEHIRFP